MKIMICEELEERMGKMFDKLQKHYLECYPGCSQIELDTMCVEKIEFLVDRFLSMHDDCHLPPEWDDDIIRGRILSD